ncbi:MAG: hypothetical protein IPP43_08110 [Chitinophagaceae bacterium]|nr:hypothetical protein [Chitinophagaceae bacterium]MBK9568489.1 hypothetical protein [Chitinophagaceae bacterium]MBL0131087.1 hypothetical protein [Chitinophagaceae bacterium]MBL0272610.1 hypothetical protein [Chitinophagaceae bacterium]
MRKKNWTLFGITAVLLAISLIAFRPSPGNTTEKPTCCKKMNECSQKEKKAAADDILLESLSRQFIAISPLVY